MAAALEMQALSRLVAGRVLAPAPTHSPKTPDPRWVLAVAASSAVEGGRAAIITPERRRRLMFLAAALRLRPFDASLVIAIVQDAARRGEPLGPNIASSVAMLSMPTPAPARITPAVLVSLSIALGVAWAAVLIALV